jgi:NADH:ubiquinone oxidoreductase subunit 5 (subunit L)/multisubunit Na+/H+ antiporter MnhA subunit
MEQCCSIGSNGERRERIMAEAPTKLWFRSEDLAWLIGGLVVAGVAAGIGLPYAWKLIGEWEWVPFHGPMKSLMSPHAPWVMIVRPLILAALGLVVALVIIDEVPEVTLTGEEIQVKKGRDTRTIRRGQVAGIYQERSKVIIESSQGRRLFHDNIEGGRQRVRDAFIAHGYPWESR